MKRLMAGGRLWLHKRMNAAGYIPMGMILCKLREAWEFGHQKPRGGLGSAYLYDGRVKNSGAVCLPATQA